MSQAPARTSHRQLYRLNVRQFEAMIGAGVFGSKKVELLDGVMVKKMTMYPPHVFAVMALGELQRDILSRTDWSVREEKPIHLGTRWRPEPDIVVARGPMIDYAKRTPTQNDAALVIEVADSSYEDDIGLKLKCYEKHGIPEYWVVDLYRRQVEIRTRGAAGFGTVVVRKEADEIPVTLDGREYGRIAVSRLFT
jgi:Uma2 family endonuclease